MIKSLRFIYLLFFCLAFTAAVNAQNPPPQPESERPFAGIPDAYFEEADGILKYCEERDALRQYYNCDCLSFKFLDTRIQMPEASPNQILNIVTYDCLDAADAAGQEYQSCLGNMPLLPANINLEDYCTCYANTYAKAVEESGMAVTSKVIVALQTQAHVFCTNPQRAKRLYPQLPGGGNP